MISPEVGWKYSYLIAFYVSQDFTRRDVPAMSAMVDNNIKNATENDDERFRVLQMIYVWGGSPLFPIERSWLYNIYSFLLVVFTYLNQVFIIVGMLKKLDDIPYIAETARALITIFSVLWVHFFIRYPAP
jgi:hypothetical protein